MANHNKWIRLLTTLTGMCVEDMHRYDRNRRHKGVQPSENEAIDVLRYSDFIAGWLKEIPNIPRQANRRAAGQIPSSIDLGLIRYTKGDADLKTRDPTENDLDTGRKSGGAYKRQCQICKFYREKNDTVWACVMCGMPLCKMDRTNTKKRRHMTCFEEHHNSENVDLMCKGVKQHKS